MKGLLEKCQVCAALLDEEDLFCANCGTEAPDRSRDSQRTTLQSTHNFQCGSCGASMSYDASARNLRCPFCGSERLDARQDEKMLLPDRVVPLAVSRPAANDLLKKWMGNSFWRPGDLAHASSVESMVAVYVPYWVFRADTLTHWTAETDQVPPGTRGNWRPIYGRRNGRYAGLLVGASGALTPAETRELCPFDLSTGIAADKVDLENTVFEQFRVCRKFARPLAQQGLEDLERQASQALVPGKSRNVKVNVLLQGLQSEPVLLPVWIMAYRYKGEVYRFLLNGQTGKATGTAPTDWRKVLLVIAVVIAIIAVIGLMIAMCAGLGMIAASRDR
ncbi:MAG: hypothetical protein FJ295_00780 [Planctomycetes bacterium]|nr:hypothetical protein [Planctomycetota bacterium]